MGYYSKRMWGGASGIVQDASLKLWLDASNPLSYPGTGTLWSDLSGNGNNGTLVNGVAFSGANGGVMSFDGVNDYVGLDKVITGIGSNTNTAWINTTKTGRQGIVGTRLDTDGYIFAINRTKLGNVTYFHTGITGSILEHSGNIGIEHWNNITSTYDNDTKVMSIYVNGVLLGSRTSLEFKNSNIAPYIGRERFADTDFYFKGLLNDVAIYNRALTPAEITQNFEATRSKYGI